MILYLWFICWLYLMIRGFKTNIYTIKGFYWFDIVCIILDLLFSPLIVLFVLYGDFKQRFIPYKPSHKRVDK